MQGGVFFHSLESKLAFCDGQAGGATASGPALGNGYEIILQGFNWESYREDWYKVRNVRATWLSDACHHAGKNTLGNLD